MANRMVLNETSYFGWNARENLVPEIKKRNFKRILVVSDYLEWHAYSEMECKISVHVRVE